MRLLQHIIEPERLSIVWQAIQEGSSTGTRYIVGELRLNERKNVELHYSSQSKDFSVASACGFKGYSVFDINQEVHTQNIEDTFNRRIPSRQRTDFQDFLRYYRIDPEIGSQITDIALLGYTGGKLPGDSFSFIHTFENAPIPCEITIEVAGARHYSKQFETLDSLVDTQVIFEAEPQNLQDPKAVIIKTKDDKKTIGYVNRAQTNIFNKWIRSNQIEAYVERVNGSSGRPNILLYVNVS